MATEFLYTDMGICDFFHEFELCPDETLTVLQTLDDNLNNNIFNVADVSLPGPLTEKQNYCMKTTNKRKKPAKTASPSYSQGFDEDSGVEHAMLRRTKSVKRQKVSVSPPATSNEDGSVQDGKVVSHIAVERNRRKQMNEHLAELRLLMPSFYVKKGDQASIVGGVIDYISELHQVLQSLKAKRRRKSNTNDVGQSPRIIATNPQVAAPCQHSKLSPFSPKTPQSTGPYKPQIKKPSVQPSTIPLPTSNSIYSCSSVADMIKNMNSYNKTCHYAVSNDLIASSMSSVADVEVKFCGPNLELKTLSSKLAGQTMKIVSVIEDLALEILQVSINTVQDCMLNVFTIKIGVECQLSAEELAQHIQQTFC